jgi:HlyD family secretion protein
MSQQGESKVVEAPARPSLPSQTHVRARPSGRRRRSPWPVRLLVLGVLAAGVWLSLRALKKPPIPVDIAVVERTTVRDEISSATAGEVMAEQKATVRAELAARVLSVKHKRGERVKSGDVVAALDTVDLDARLKEAQSTIASQRASVAQADAHLATARQTAERAKRLAEHGAETVKAADDAAALVAEAEAALHTASAVLEQSKAAWQVAKVARTHGALTAPFDGVLADVFVSAGDQTQPGSPVFELVDDSRLHVEATIDEADIARVKLGQPATLRLDALPGQPITGAVSKLDPTVRTDAKGARTLRLEVEVSDLRAALAAGIRPGMSANVDVRVAEKQNVLSLPTTVIVGRGLKRSVDLIDQGVARERPIQVGISSWERTEIVSGLREGDRVVASLNVKGLADGVPVVATGVRIR